MEWILLAVLGGLLVIWLSSSQLQAGGLRIENEQLRRENLELRRATRHAGQPGELNNPGCGWVLVLMLVMAIALVLAFYVSTAP